MIPWIFQKNFKIQRSKARCALAHPASLLSSAPVLEIWSEHRTISHAISYLQVFPGHFCQFKVTSFKRVEFTYSLSELNRRDNTSAIRLKLNDKIDSWTRVHGFGGYGSRGCGSNRWTRWRSSLAILQNCEESLSHWGYALANTSLSCFGTPILTHWRGSLVEDLFWTQNDLSGHFLCAKNCWLIDLSVPRSVTWLKCGEFVHSLQPSWIAALTRSARSCMTGMTTAGQDRDGFGRDGSRYFGWVHCNGCRWSLGILQTYFNSKKGEWRCAHANPAWANWILTAFLIALATC